MNPKIVLFLLLPLLIIGWVTPTNTPKRTDKGKGLQLSAGSAFTAYKAKGNEEIKSPLSVKSAFRPYKQKDDGKNAENEQKNETDGQQRADTTGDNEQLRGVATENVDQKKAVTARDDHQQRGDTTGNSTQLGLVAEGDVEQQRAVAERDSEQSRVVAEGDVDKLRADTAADPMEVSADGSHNARTLKPSGDGSTSSRRKSDGNQSPLGRHNDAQRSSEAKLSADTANAGNNGGAENDDHEMAKREEAAQKKTPMKRRLIKQKTMEKSSKRTSADKKKNVDSLSMERSVNSNPFESAEDAPSLASTSQNNLLEAQLEAQAAQIQKLQELYNELQQKVHVGKQEGQQGTQQSQAATAEQQQQLLQELRLSQVQPEQHGQQQQLPMVQQQQQQQLPMVQQQLAVNNSLQPQYAAPSLVAQHPQLFQAQPAQTQQQHLPMVQQQPVAVVGPLQPQNAVPLLIAQQPQPQQFSPAVWPSSAEAMQHSTAANVASVSSDPLKEQLLDLRGQNVNNLMSNVQPSTRQFVVQKLLQQQQMQQQQPQQHQFQQSLQLRRATNPGLSINPVRTQQQLQQQHVFMGSPPAVPSLQQFIQDFQQQQLQPLQLAPRLPISYNLSPISIVQRVKEQQRKKQHDAGTSNKPVAGEVRQQWQQLQHDDDVIDATPLRASIPLREKQSHQVATFAGAGPSGHSGDQLPTSANAGGNVVESQRRHSRVEKAKQIAITAAASDDNQINNLEKIVVQAIKECIKKTLAKSGIEPEMFNLSLTSNNESTSKYLNFIQLNRDNPDDIISELRTFFQQNNGGGDQTALIVQILDEISMEIENFDSNVPSSSNSASPLERAAHHQKRFLFGNYRLYHKLLKLLSATAQQLKDGLRKAPTRFQQLHKLVTAMGKGFRQILEKFEKQNANSVNWCSNLFLLEDAIESAKLALLVAFPPNSLNEWIKNGGKWEMLNGIVDEAMFNEFLAYYDDKASTESTFIDKIQKYSENECYGLFSDFEVNYLRNLANQISQNAFVGKPLTVQTNILNLTITLAILQKIIVELEINPNLFILESVKCDKEIATNFLHLCVSLLDAKFEHFRHQVLARLDEFDRIRKGILDGQGQSSKTK
ncbi:hypothetical protein niasHT_023000 [Heterodera trifolii]|uniref:Uncharacterized protein n=1 Tax=Heterodera trifolii TaxID=157864 RepID=A0ABD2JX93_9BILA